MNISEDAFRQLAEDIANMRSRIARLERIESAGIFTPASGVAAGSSGLAPAPALGDQNNVLHGDGTWRGSLDLTGYVKAANDMYPYGDTLGLMRRLVNRLGNTLVTDHFRGGSIPSGHTWQGAPFATPTSLSYNNVGDYLAVAHASSLAFLAKTSITTYLNKTITARVSPTANSSIGLRADDGTDNNYFQCYLVYGSGGVGTFKTQQRTGGGAVTTTTATTALMDSFYVMKLLTFNNGAGHTPIFYLVNELGDSLNMVTGTASTWTVSRAGIVLNADSGSKGGLARVDWFYTEYT